MNAETPQLDPPTEQANDRPEECDAQPDDPREYPLERAFSTRERVEKEASPSVGWQRMIHEMHCETSSIDYEAVTSS